jgi:ketosteroid isomerase-like protein
MAYHTIVASIARKQFDRVNQKDYAGILHECAPDVHHRFGGDQALGGERHSKEALAKWFDRLGRLGAKLTLTVQDVWVKGWPWDTTVIVRWTATDTLVDGGEYRNRGVHVIRMAWGKFLDIDANEDSQAVARNMALQKECGIEEAGMPPILS